MKKDARPFEEDARRLREYATFDNFSDGDLQRLARAAHRISTSAPSPLVHEQTPSDSCYILLRGEVGVYVGRDLIVALGPGEVIGESALQRGRLRSATVTTMGSAELLRIERDDLAKLLDDLPALREIIDASVARHVPVDLPPKPKPSHSKLRASVPTDVVERFERAAEGAGVDVATALEDALTGWIERNSAGAVAD
ncbi:cyclic nucleotide-binding domain-containing protein [Mycobacterium sp. 94-17]|uniref:cyclic nucleotide-binding domain-containing protein n=1 Tax=Mycobacterium sp. 94-17 TaxID=2986147 RepID=UPI002D1E6E57|nr:cyclic nucleotide-binding domain-containing protein [Mycobacterium sp. 94-17]MEB4212344.1 cyclic nucleotide-binding domain-containing protein [Mycobacterium sp. 94-17]